MTTFFSIIQDAARYIIPGLLFFIPLFAFFRKVPVYETFVEGAAEGIGMAVQIFPFLLGTLMAVAVFRASGAFEALTTFLQPFADALHIPTEVLPVAFMRPLSGSGSLGLVAELLQTHGPDSFIGRVASVMQGSTDTTFYILTVYFGAVGIRKYRYALPLGLAADLLSFLCALTVCRLLF